jgi:hypothetical protein
MKIDIVKEYLDVGSVMSQFGNGQFEIRGESWMILRREMRA